MWKTVYLVVISTLAVAAMVAIDRNAHKPQPTESRGDLPLQPVESARIFAQGLVEGASGEIELRPSLAGPVEEIFVTDGQLVAAGQPLVRLQDGHYRQRAELARAELLEAQAKLQRLQNGPTAYERLEVDAQHQAKLVELNHEESLWNRMSQLLQAEAITQQQADDHSAKLQMLKAEVAAAKARLDRLTNEPRGDDIQVASAAVASANARFELAQAELARTTLRASVAGQVVKLNVDLGEATGPAAAEAAVILADPSHKRVRAYVEELDAPQLALGVAAHVTADGLRGKDFRGRVSWLSPRMGSKSLWSNRPDERRDTKTREVLIDLDGPTDELVVGLRVDVYIDQSPVTASLTASGIIAEQGGSGRK